MTSRVDAGLLTICVTGPESTGKTTLARRLGEQLSVEWVPEASRLYAERIGRDLSVIDVEPIAREHIALADAARARAIGVGASVLVLDTDLASTVVYGKHYYDVAVPWLDAALVERRADLYLLCDTDVPWVADGIRDAPAHRDEVFASFGETLRRMNARVEVIRGQWKTRWSQAWEIVGRTVGQ